MILFANPFLLVHIVTAILAVLVGTWLFVIRKGTRHHAVLGRIFIVTMLTTNLSVVPVQARVAPFGDSGFGFFHIFAALSLFSLVSGLIGLRRWLRSRDPEALRSHQINFAFAYLGLIMALASEVLVNRNLGLSPVTTAGEFWMLLTVVNVVIYAIGFTWIMGRLRKGDPLRHRADGS